jgi:phosphotriesterase-related protein
MAIIQSVLGPVSTDELGLILPHEHLFTDLRGVDHPHLGEGEPKAVARAMMPYLDEAYEAGVTALVECTPAGVGRNPQVLEHLAQQTEMPLVMPAGVYRQEYIPSFIQDMSEEELAVWMTRHIAEGFEGSGAKAGFIKLAVSNEGITQGETKSLRAAARASLETGVVIASHTSGPLSGAHALQELEILASRGLGGHRFIWVHAQNDTNVQSHVVVAERDAYIGFDGLRPDQEERYLGLVMNALEAGLERHILLSHDAGWYRPGEPEGGATRGFTYLVNDFLPLLREKGVDEDTIRLMTEENPKRAFALEQS